MELHTEKLSVLLCFIYDFVSSSFLTRMCGRAHATTDKNHIIRKVVVNDEYLYILFTFQKS